MGGDGGTVAANRAYLRGTGKADHTADRASSSRPRASGVEDDANRARAALTTCSISGATLDPRANDVVACPHGRLYRREEALEALLRRSSSSRAATRGGGGRGEDEGGGCRTMGDHVRGMRDLHPVRFHLTTGGPTTVATPTCPVTGSDIGNGKVPCFLVVRSNGSGGDGDDDGGRDRGPNVLSERAIREMGIRGLQEEYGPFEEGDMIRLAPPLTGGVFEGIRKRWEERMEGERIAKVSGVPKTALVVFWFRSRSCMSASVVFIFIFFDPRTKTASPIDPPPSPPVIRIDSEKKEPEEGQETQARSEGGRRRRREASSPEDDAVVVVAVAVVVRAAVDGSRGFRREEERRREGRRGEGGARR